MSNNNLTSCHTNCNSLFSGVLEEEYVSDVLDGDYFSSITEDMNNTWKNDHGGKGVRQSLNEYLVDYMGKPMLKLLR